MEGSPTNPILVLVNREAEQNNGKANQSKWESARDFGQVSLKPEGGEKTFISAEGVRL